jgi:hypothetical protein
MLTPDFASEHIRPDHGSPKVESIGGPTRFLVYSRKNVVDSWFPIVGR